MDGQLGGGTGLEEGRWVDEVIKGMPLKDIFFLELSVLPLLPGHYGAIPIGCLGRWGADGTKAQLVTVFVPLKHKINSAFSPDPKMSEE